MFLRLPLKSLSITLTKSFRRGNLLKEESLKQAILKSGFLLEGQTAKVFSDSGYNVKQNRRIEGDSSEKEFPRRLHEIDVLAIHQSDFTKKAFIVECKGSASTDVLVLIKTAQNHHSFPTTTVLNRRIIQDPSENITCNNTHKNSASCCHTGDFFGLKKSGNDEYEKISKNEDQNNFFKGVQQLHIGINSFFKEYGNGDSAYSMYSLIVTNADIIVASLSNDLKNKEVLTKKVPWA